jgi:hypothetical protein
MHTRHRIAALAVGTLALLVWAAPAHAQVPPTTVPGAACGAVGTVEGTAGQDVPADAVCPTTTTPSDSGSTDYSTTTTTYDSGSASTPASTSLPRTGMPATLAGAGVLTAAAAFAVRFALRRSVRA